MEDSAATEGMTRFPPGAAAPTAAQLKADRIARLRSPEHLQRLNAARADWLALPKEERSRIVSERKAEKEAKRAAREAKRAAKNGHAAPPSESSESGPPTVRSQRSSLSPAPESEIPRPGAMAGPLKGLLDICSAMPRLGDGTCFIQVTRVKPPQAFGVPCAGVQRPIWGPVDDAEFALEYGGAEYQLRGYQLRDDGRSPKALTEPVTYKVAGPPNLGAALTEEDMMRPMQAQIPNGSPGGVFRRPGIVSPQQASAEAEMHDRNLTHEEEMDERQARRAEERRRREEAREQRGREENLGMARIMAEAKDKEAERLAEAHREQLRLLQERSGGMAEVAELLRVLKPGDETAALTKQHSAEIRQLTESHKEQMMHLTESHQAEMRRQAELHMAAIQRLDDQLRADRDRSDRLIRETDQRAAEQIREAERRADQRVIDAQNAARAAYDDLKTRSQERLDDQANMSRQRIEDMREAHARELKRKDDELLLMRTNLEGNVAVIMAQKDNEIKRLQHELREAKNEAESNKDWTKKAEEFEQRAEALGYSKAEPGEGTEEDLKTTAVKAGLGMLQRLPELIASSSDAIAKMRSPAVSPDAARAQARAVRPGGMRTVPRTHGMGLPPPMLQPLAFATEDGGFSGPSDQVFSPPRPQQQQPQFPVLEQASIAPPVQTMQPMPQHFEPEQQQQFGAPALGPSQYQQPAPQPAPAPAAPAMAPNPAPVAAAAPPPVSVPPPSIVAPAAPAAGSAAPLDPTALEIINQFTPTLAAQFDQRLPAAEVSRQIVESNTPDLVRIALSMVTIDQLLAHIVQNPEAHGQLASRNGQKFLREVWRTTEQAVAQ